jgi:hypothetical protein
MTIRLLLMIKVPYIQEFHLYHLLFNFDVKFRNLLSKDIQTYQKLNFKVLYLYE